MRVSRRITLAGLAVLASTPAFGKSKKKPKKTSPSPIVDSGPIDDFTQSLLNKLPETATYSGTPGSLDGGPLAQKMTDHSPAGEAALRSDYVAAQALLSRIRIDPNSPMGRHLGTVSAILNNANRTVSIPYGHLNILNFSGHTPYVVSQISGPHIDSINIMMEQQSLGTPKAVDAWIQKLDSFPKSFAGVIEKLKADEAAGCIPPRILLEKTLPVLDAFLAGKTDAHPLIKNLQRRTAEAGLANRTRTLAIKRARLSLERQAKPAMLALREAVAALVQKGRSDAGIWAQPQGEAFYAANVQTLGDTSMSPDEIHRIGMDEASRIAAEMSALLEKQGLSQGSIGARMTALAKDPKNQFPDSDAGREALLSYVRQKVKEAEAMYSQLLPAELIPTQALIVKRVPLATQDSAPGGFYDAPSLDGTRPGTYWINLRDMAAVPRFRLPTLSYHEGVPGHHTQGSISAALTGAPLLVRIASFNANAEGWALYGERLMAELGVYKDDPLGDLGRLQDELFRAVRLVIDTGLHHKRWTREQAIRVMRDITGVAESRVTAEVERYMAWPGQALGYKLGQLRLLDMRRDYLAKLGKNADLKKFHAAVLSQGVTPLDLVAARVAALK
jgi:uncharacterized protein (DUF885 family)